MRVRKYLEMLRANSCYSAQGLVLYRRDDFQRALESISDQASTEATLCSL